jgi:hypothetical protein
MDGRVRTLSLGPSAHTAWAFILLKMVFYDHFFYIFLKVASRMFNQVHAVQNLYLLLARNSPCLWVKREMMTFNSGN